MKPLKAGTIDLHLKATIPIRNSDIGEELYDLKVMDKTIKVEVNAWYTSREFIRVNWKEIMASIVLPLIVWGFKRYTDIKDRKQEQDEQHKLSHPPCPVIIPHTPSAHLIEFQVN